VTAEPKVHVFSRSENAQEIGFSSDVPSSSEGIMKWSSSVFLVTPTLGKDDIWRHTSRPWSRYLPRSTVSLKPHFQTSNFSACSRRRPQPLPLGYCNVGTVLQAGAGVSGIAAGDRVVSNGKHAEVVSVPLNLGNNWGQIPINSNIQLWQSTPVFSAQPPFRAMRQRPSLEGFCTPGEPRPRLKLYKMAAK